MNSRTIKLVLSVMLLLAMTAPIFAQPSRAASQSGVNSISQQIPINRVVTVACAERRIRLTGEFQALFKVSRDENGNLFVEADFNSEGVSGLGLTSGNQYEATGPSHFNSSGSSRLEFTYVSNFVFVRPASTDHLMAHVTFRIIVTGDAQVAVTIRNVSIDCGG